MTRYFQIGDSVVEIEAMPAGEGFVIQVGDETMNVESWQRLPDGLRVKLEGRWQTVFVSRSGQEWWLSYEGQTFLARQTARAVRRGGGAGAAAGDGVLRAPMPGQVRTVQVAAGDMVAKGQTLMLLEAMKMEIRIRAPCAGEVEHIAASAGEIIQQGQTLAIVLCKHHERSYGESEAIEP